MSMYMSLRNLFVLGVAWGLSWSTVFASPQSNDDQLDEIIVIAQKRPELLQDVPIQVDVITPKDMDARQIKMTTDIVNTIPNFVIERTDVYTNSVIVLRGISQASNADAPVAVLVDGVPQDDPKQFNMHLFDLAQMEVLKGPQGSLYGRNAEAGAVIITTAPPTNELSGFADVSYGNGSTIDASGGVSGAIVPDKVQYRLSGDFFQTGGFIKNSYSGRLMDRIPYDWTLRGTLHFVLNEKSTLDLIGQYGKYSAGSVYFEPVVPGNANHFVNPQGNFPNRASGSNLNLTAKFQYDLGFATFSSISGYTRLRQVQITDTDFTNPASGLFPFQLGDNQPFRNDIFSEELRLVGPADSRLRWLVAADYLNADQFINTHLFFDTGHPDTDPFDPALTLTENPGKNRRDSYGISGQLDYDILPDLTLTFGGRYDTDRRKQIDLKNILQRSATFSDFTPKVVLAYKFDPMRLVYASYSSGFRSGGFNAPSFHIPLYDAEELTNYEVGFKTQWLDRRLTINGAAFVSDVDNYQFSYIDFGTGSEVTGNINRVQITGGELEGWLEPTTGLRLFANLGVAQPRIKKFSTFPLYVGNHTPRTSDMSVNWGIDYTRPISDTLTFFARADAQHYGKRYWFIDNNDVQHPKTYVNASIGLTRGPWTLTLWGKNIFDERSYETYFPSQATGLPYDVAFPNRPATYGLEIKAEY